MASGWSRTVNPQTEAWQNDSAIKYGHNKILGTTPRPLPQKQNSSHVGDFIRSTTSRPHTSHGYIDSTAYANNNMDSHHGNTNNPRVQISNQGSSIMSGVNRTMINFGQSPNMYNTLDQGSWSSSNMMTPVKPRSITEPFAATKGQNTLTTVANMSGLSSKMRLGPAASQSVYQSTMDNPSTHSTTTTFGQGGAVSNAASHCIAHGAITEYTRVLQSTPEATTKFDKSNRCGRMANTVYIGNTVNATQNYDVRGDRLGRKTNTVYESNTVSPNRHDTSYGDKFGQSNARHMHNAGHADGSSNFMLSGYHDQSVHKSPDSRLNLGPTNRNQSSKQSVLFDADIWTYISRRNSKVIEQKFKFKTTNIGSFSKIEITGQLKTKDDFLNFIEPMKMGVQKEIVSIPRNKWSDVSRKVQKHDDKLIVILNETTQEVVLVGDYRHVQQQKGDLSRTVGMGVALVKQTPQRKNTEGTVYVQVQVWEYIEYRRAHTALDLLNLTNTAKRCGEFYEIELKVPQNYQTVYHREQFVRLYDNLVSLILSRLVSPPRTLSDDTLRKSSRTFQDLQKKYKNVYMYWLNSNDGRAGVHIIGEDEKQVGEVYEEFNSRAKALGPPSGSSVLTPPNRLQPIESTTNVGDKKEKKKKEKKKNKKVVSSPVPSDGSSKKKKKKKDKKGKQKANTILDDNNSYDKNSALPSYDSAMVPYGQQSKSGNLNTFHDNRNIGRHAKSYGRTIQPEGSTETKKSKHKSSSKCCLL